MGIRVNLKNIARAFRSGVEVGSAGMFAVSSISLHVVEGIKWVRIDTIDRNDYCDLTAKKLKHKITKMRTRAENTNPNHRDWMLELHFHGNVLESQKRRID
jgi:hypothetical protein